MSDADKFLNYGTTVTDTNTTEVKKYTFGNNFAAMMGTAEGTPATLTITGEKKNSVILQYDPGTGEFKGIGAGTTATAELSLTGLPNFNNITIDFSASSNVNNEGTSTVSATSGDKDGYGAGRKLGDMTGVSIQNNGMIYATYDNGQSKLLGQIAVASFANASGLAKEGDNLYSATQNSGQFDGIGIDITADGGYMTTGELEMSNVDLSAELTGMIVTQRGFQANSRIITVSDSMLEELVNLKRS